MAPRPSPFLDPGPVATTETLGIIHLKRDLLVPTILESPSANTFDYAEGKVTNTRFGSFPHSTLLGLPWGSQVLASIVDTGSRGGKGGKGGKKRKRDAEEENGRNGEGEESRSTKHKAAVAASTGFAHLLPPTPESWTISLPHRTQVVYTPDYSYILQRLGTRPGDTIIEAGAGSGSFSHAAARAVFNGYLDDQLSTSRPKKRRCGKVYSFEFHAPRVEQLRQETKDHGLDSIIEVTHRDVYQDGFCVDKESCSDPEPQADCVFLDLPAPWLALKHLTRNPISPSTLKSLDSPSPAADQQGQVPNGSTPTAKEFRSPLNPYTATRICTFSPCIEQVTKTVSAMRQLGWVDIEMVELQHRRLDVRRDRVGISEEGIRGGNPAPATVEESLFKLREHGERHEAYQEVRRKNAEKTRSKGKTGESNMEFEKDLETVAALKAKRVEDNVKRAMDRYLFNEGRVTHRTEPEIKTHTSYLTFAVLPRSWTAEDEVRCKEQWPIKAKATSSARPTTES